MKHLRRAAVVVTGLAGLLAASAHVVVGVHEAPAPRPTSQAAPVAPEARATAGPSAEFVVPRHVPAPPAGVLGSEDDMDVLGPNNVVIPSPSPSVAPRAVIRAA